MSYTYTHLEDFIQKVYRKLNIRSHAELNIYAIADSLNIGVYPINENSQAIQLDGRQYIFLNNSLSNLERFEVFAHELGHILLHSSQQHMQEDYRAYQEWRANLFALHFCIPTFMLQKLQNNYLNPHQISEMFGVTTNFAQKRLELYFQKIMDYKYAKKTMKRNINMSVF